ncbi:MAG: thiamine pyrophosphate-dependent dehydrogenase E1 component subunit alpha [Jatrophihabitans sp.]
MSQPSPRQRQSLYRGIRLIRRFEQRSLELVKAGEIVSGMHACIGQEAVAVGTCAALDGSDVMLSTHRGHGHFLAKGSQPGPVLAEMLGRGNGIDQGRGGSFHPSDFSANIYNATGTVGHSAAIAAGVAWSVAPAGTGQVVLCFFGDGAVSQGALLEGFNLASLWKLPVIYVCENNQYATTLPVGAAVAGSITGRGEAFGIPSETVDGQDVEVVLAATTRAVERARAGGGPSLIEANTYRYFGHHTFELKVRLSYRPEGELERWHERDPLDIAASRVDEQSRQQIDAEVERVIEAAVEFALAGPKLDPVDAQEFTYTSGPRPRAGVAS